MSTLLNVIATSGSAQVAQNIRLNTIASNLANVDSVSGTEGKTYRTRHPVFSTMLIDNDPNSVGVRVQQIVESNRPLQLEYRPDHPEANSNGMVYKTNVNAIEEMADMISASRSYQINVEISETAKKMLLRTLSLGQ